MSSFITAEIVDLIMRAKSYLPAGYRIQTIEEQTYLILHVDKREFEKFNIHERIKIAETLNELCEKIKETGCPCVIQKM